MPFEIPLITINAQENVKIKCRSMGINVPEENLSKYSDALSIEELKNHHEGLFDLILKN